MSRFRTYGMFGLGVISHGKDKVSGKVRKWSGIVRNPQLRRSWEAEMAKRGEEARNAITSHFLKAAECVGIKRAADALPHSFHLGDTVHFYALDTSEEIAGTIVSTQIEPSNTYFLVKAVSGKHKSRIYICKDYGDVILGDSEL
ncbi:hypothetical protein [Alicyclobacillus acidoterrestris]|uniref:Uncharacterized protein n=1 Tax=Alicyclobacillus acidoterrestris (strain ATCC 49025 / DSM 3922 / CIP 106132 / NCIMB 13137 / GD3B) TaxID=1356854 RepID=T0D253_ALIAG|nr:hypothetical protein [Alicyclobacillus acidoterrestris]EPZ45637.1 hypothetical protein N007_08310 [Alicyclobacillus acidoterrestris ATCC 49025]UNO47315.1 hypothetical protein K1I37_11290 [Alicyclobacillus acidoterrestris]